MAGRRGRGVLACLLLTAAVALQAQGDGRAQLAAGHEAWSLRLANRAIAAFEAAAKDTATAAEAHEALGRIYLFKGWQQEGVFPGWHDEPEYRDRALAAFEAALAADPSRASARAGLETARRFASMDAVDPAAPRPEVKALDEALAALRGNTSATSADVLAAVEARTRAQADPAPYFLGAQLLIDRRDFDGAIALARRGAEASDRFIAENESAYKMSGKSQGARARGRAAALDLVGWATFLKGDQAGAAGALEEAGRLSRGLDFANQYHLAELAMAQKDTERAGQHYLNALSLAGGPAPLRERAKQALAGLHRDRPDFEAWLEATLNQRRDGRRAAALRSLLDRPLPALSLTTPDGRAYEIAALRGKVLLLNFFSSW